MSLARHIRLIREGGISRYFRNIQYLGDVKAGTYVGSDVAGNKYYEDLNEIPGRHRWVEFQQGATHNASQVEPVWHAWLHHIQDLPPSQDQKLQEVRRVWEAPALENLTGTRGAFKTYSTTKRKIQQWEPKVASREA